MHQHLEGDDLLAYLRMLRSTDQRLFFVIEGVSDGRALERHTDSERCAVIVGYGKTAVLEALATTAIEDPTGCVGLVDRDFGDLLSPENLPNVFMTELYDREADFLLIGNLIDDYISAYARDEAVAKVLRASQCASIRAIVVGMATVVGRLRWVLVRENIRIGLAAFPFGRVIKWPCVIDKLDVIRLAIKRSDNSSVSTVAILEAYEKPFPAHPCRMCSGHDLVSCLAASSKWWATRKLSIREIEGYISAAVRRDVLEQMSWFGVLETWASERGRLLWSRCG